MLEEQCPHHRAVRYQAGVPWAFWRTYHRAPPTLMATWPHAPRVPAVPPAGVAPPAGARAARARAG